MGDISSVFLHFRQDVAHNLPILVLSDERELGPGKTMVEIIFHLIVLGKAEEVAVLHVHQVAWLSITNVHNGGDSEVKPDSGDPERGAQDAVYL